MHYELLTCGFGSAFRRVYFFLECPMDVLHMTWRVEVMLRGASKHGTGTGISRLFPLDSV